MATNGIYAVNPDTFQVCKVVYSIVINNKYNVITDDGLRFTVKYMYFTVRAAKQAAYNDILAALAD